MGEQTAESMARRWYFEQVRSVRSMAHLRAWNMAPPPPDGRVFIGGRRGWLRWGSAESSTLRRRVPITGTRFWLGGADRGIRRAVDVGSGGRILRRAEGDDLAPLPFPPGSLWKLHGRQALIHDLNCSDSGFDCQSVAAKTDGSRIWARPPTWARMPTPSSIATTTAVPLHRIPSARHGGGPFQPLP